MIKLITLIAILLSTQNLYAFDLVSGDNYYGVLDQETERPVKDEIEITRTAATPRKVKLTFKYDTERTYCSRYITLPDFDRHRRRFRDRVCVDYETEIYQISDKLSLNFTRAKRLINDQEEVFIINISQKEFGSGRFKLKVEEINTIGPYKIEYPVWLLGQGIKFISK